MPERFAEPGDTARSLAALGGNALRSLVDVGDAQPAGRRGHLGEQGPGGGGRVLGSARVGACSGVEEAGAVAYRAGEGVIDAEAEERLADMRARWRAPACGLEAEQTAARGGDANRTAGVVAVGHGHHTGGDGGCRASTRAAG